MKILHTLFWTHFAGTEKVCVDLCNEMSKRHDVFLLSDEKITPYLRKSVNLISFDFEQNRYSPIFLYKTAKKIDEIAPDIIHCHNTKEIEIAYYARLFMKKRVPIVATRHNPILKNKFKYADFGVAVSEETLEFTNTKNKILIENGIKFIEPKNLNFKENFNIIAAGRLVKVKGFDVIIRALKNVSFDFKLRIIGEGELENSLLDLIKELDLDRKIELVGFVNNVNDYLFSSDLQVISSFEEGLSLSLIEGIFYSKILLASDIATHKDILGNKLVFDVNSKNNIEILTQKLNDIYNNYDEYKAVFKTIKENSEKYDIKNVISKYIQVYQKSLTDKKISC
ncbi:MAG: glycosyltransferase [Campylobacter sp.]|nr:glycosyltransferase [Campylobacter sp.]